VLAGLVLVYGMLLRHLPIHGEEPLEPEAVSAPAGRPAEALG
jgi:hypothetical protein